MKVLSALIISILVPLSAFGLSIDSTSFFYNESFYQGETAPGKTAFLSTQSEATSANFTNYSGGVGGIIVDFNLESGESLSASDFSFEFIDNSQWTALSIAPTIEIDGSRSTVSWSFDGAVKDNWLKVTVQGLAEQMFFGSIVGDANEDGALSPIDALLIINDINENGSHLSSIGDPMDINRDGSVNPMDVLLIVDRLNSGDDFSLLMNPNDIPDSTGFTPIDITDPFVPIRPFPLSRLYDPDAGIPTGYKLAISSEPDSSDLFALRVVPLSVPEPANMLLLGSGLLCFVVLRKKVKKTA